LQDVLQSLYAGTFNDICAFLKGIDSGLYEQNMMNATDGSSTEDKIPVGLILTGAGIASHGQLFEDLQERIKSERLGPAVILSSAGSTSVKIILKRINQAATNSDFTDEDDESDSKGVCVIETSIANIPDAKL
jgi:hypothetical protein